MHSSTQEFVARENIRRFEAQLESTTEEAQKSTIKALLEVERQHLHEIVQSERFSRT